MKTIQEQLASFQAQLNALAATVGARGSASGAFSAQEPAAPQSVEGNAGPLKAHLYLATKDEAGRSQYQPIQVDENGAPKLNDQTSCCANRMSNLAKTDAANVFTLGNAFDNTGTPGNTFATVSLRTSTGNGGVLRAYDNSSNIVFQMVGASSQLRANQDGALVWTTSGNAAGTVDLGINRDSAGVASITDGYNTANGGALRDLKVRNLIATGTVSGSGNTIYSGAGAPGSLSGNLNDLYYDTTNKEFYQNDGAGSWVLLGLSATDLTAGTTPTARYPGGAFNGASELVQLTAATKYPALDGSLITNLPGANLQGGNGALNAAGQLTLTLSGAPTYMTCAWKDAAGTGQLYTTNLGANSWQITSTAGVVDSGVTVYWMAN